MRGIALASVALSVSGAAFGAAPVGAQPVASDAGGSDAGGSDAGVLDAGVLDAPGPDGDAGPTVGGHPDRRQGAAAVPSSAPAPTAPTGAQSKQAPPGSSSAETAVPARVVPARPPPAGMTGVPGTGPTGPTEPGTSTSGYGGSAAGVPGVAPSPAQSTVGISGSPEGIPGIAGLAVQQRAKEPSGGAAPAKASRWSARAAAAALSPGTVPPGDLPAVIRRWDGAPLPSLHLTRYGDATLARALTRQSAVALGLSGALTLGGLSPGGDLLVNSLRVVSSDLLPLRAVPVGVLASPNGLWSSVSVHRIYQPFLPGELGGGIVALETPAAPEAPTLWGAATLGLRAGTTLSAYPSQPRGATDFLGFDDGQRALPSAIAALRGETLVLEGRKVGTSARWRVSELSRLAQAFSDGWDPEALTALPDSALSLRAGDRVVLGKFEFGYTAAATHRRSTSFRRYIDRIFRPSFPLESDDAGRGLDRWTEEWGQEATDHVALGGFLAAEAHYAEAHVTRLQLLALRDSEQLARVGAGRGDSDMADAHRTVMAYRERQTLSLQLLSDHHLGQRAALRLRYGYGVGSDTRPDVRHALFHRRPSSRQAWFPALGESTTRSYHAASERTHDGGLDLGGRFTFAPGMLLWPRVGFQVMAREGDDGGRTFGFSPSGGSVGPAEVGDYGPLFEPYFEGSAAESEVGRLVVAEQRGLPLAEFFRVQLAPYALLHVTFGELFSVSLGARLEYDRLRLESEWFAPLKRADDALIPSAAITWVPAEKAQVRLSGSRTRLRPGWRLMRPLAYRRWPAGPLIQGNRDLRPTSALNARLDLQFGEGRRSVTVGGYLREIDMPTQPALVSPLEGAVTYVNAHGASVRGFELASRFGPDGAPELRPLFVASQATLQVARVTMPLRARMVERDLADAPDMLFGLQLGYDGVDDGVGLFFALAYRYQSSSSFALAQPEEGTPDLRLGPLHELDLVVTHHLTPTFRLGLVARNLLDAPRRVTQGRHLVYRDRLGRLIELGVSLEY